MKQFNLSEWALEHQSLVLYCMIALFASGIYAVHGLGEAEDPDFTFKLMVVQTMWPGATTTQVEQEITDRIEKKLQETPWLGSVRSYSKPGESTIFVVLKEAAPPKDVPEIWYQVRKEVGDIKSTLPDGVQGPYFNDEFGDTFGNVYAFTADGFSYAQLKDYVEDVRKEILRVPDVAKADLVGVQEERIYVEVSQKKFANLGIDPYHFFDDLKNQNAMTPAGHFDSPFDRFYVRVTGAFDSVDKIREIGIRANGHLFRLGDIARVYRAYVDPPVFKMRYMGHDAIGLAVSMTKGGNIIELGENLRKAFDGIKANMPRGIEVYQVSNQPLVVQRSVNEFLETLLAAVVIVLAVSFLSLGLRTGLVVATSIPLVLCVTFLLMWLYGIDLQRISLGALIIALGLLVDDAIIAVEMMATKMEQGWERKKAASFAYTSTAFPMLTGTLVTISGFLPVGLARSSAGEFTFSLFAVVSIALLVSWVVAVLFTPYIGYKILPDFKPRPGHDHDVYQRPFYRGFRRVVTWCVTHRKLVILVTVGVFALALFAFRFVQDQFFPPSNRPELIMDLRLPEGASFAATEREVERMEGLLKGDPNIVNYVAYVGGNTPRFYLPLDQQLNQINIAQIVILTKDNKAREAVNDRLQKVLADQFTGLRGRINRLENGPPVGYPIQFRVSGKDPNLVRHYAEEVAAVMRRNPHALNVNLDWNERTKVIKLNIDQNKARAIGINSQDLSAVLNAILVGYDITEYRERDKLIKVVARAPANERVDVADLGDITVPTSSGKYIPLAQIAKPSYEFEDGIIWRRQRLPTITVRSDIFGDIQAPVVTAQINPELDPIRAKLPEGYYIEVGGATEDSAKAGASIAAVMPLMVLAIITVLMIQLQSLQRTFLVLLTAPLGLIGVVAVLLVWNVAFGFVSTLGVIALAGMIMRNAVILIDQIEQDHKSGHSHWDAVVEATVRRFRPIMLTAAAAVLAMIPLTRSNFWGPMAVAIMGGLLVATVLTLLFLPALYSAWFRIKRPEAQSGQ